jgi:hypothetical protein
MLDLEYGNVDQNCRLSMREYIVDVSESSEEALKETLDYMSGRGWKVVSVMWLPSRTQAGEQFNAQYTIVFERESEQ